jgi:hypothetical protein
MATIVGRNMQQATLFIIQQIYISVYAIAGLVSQNKQTLVQKFSTIQVYNALAVPNLLYGIEILTLRKKDEKKY